MYASFRRMTLSDYGDERIKLMVTQWSPEGESKAVWSSDNIRERLLELVYTEETTGVLNLRFSDSVTRKILINA